MKLLWCAREEPKIPFLLEPKPMGTKALRDVGMVKTSPRISRASPALRLPKSMAALAFFVGLPWDVEGNLAMIASIDGESELEVKEMSRSSWTAFIGTGWHQRQGSEELGPEEHMHPRWDLPAHPLLFNLRPTMLSWLFWSPIRKQTWIISSFRTGGSSPN